MIGKVTLGSYAMGLLEYCYYEKLSLNDEKRQKLTLDDVRGEVIHIQNLAIKNMPDGRHDIGDLTKQFLNTRDMNPNLKKYVWHQSFSFPEHEKPNKAQIQAIAEKFAKDFGFENNQMIVFKHNDTAHNHFHIVANRLNVMGITTASNFKNYQRTGDFCRKIEKEMGFSLTPAMRISDEMKSQRHRHRHSESDNAQRIRQSIDKTLSQNPTIDNLKQALKLDGIKTYIGRGISFIEEATGAKFKGSDLGKDYSLNSLSKSLGKHDDAFLKRKRYKKGLSLKM